MSSLLGGMGKSDILNNISNLNSKETNNYINRFLENNNDRDMTNNYSSNITDFNFVSSNKCKIYRMLVYIEDNSSMKYEDFGSISNGLINGLRVYYKETSSSNKVYIDGGYPIKTNSDFSKVCYDVDIKISGTGNNHFSSRWTFEKSGTLIYLDSGGEIGVTLNDDLSSLVQFNIVVQGFNFQS